MMTGQQSSRAGWLWMSGLTAVAAVSSLASGSSCSAMGVEGDGGGGDPNSGGATSTSSDTGGAGGTHPPFTETTPTDQCPRPDTPWLPLAVDDPAFLRFNLVHYFHCLDNADRGIFVNCVTDFHEGIRVR